MTTLPHERALADHFTLKYIRVTVHLGDRSLVRRCFSSMQAHTSRPVCLVVEPSSSRNRSGRVAVASFSCPHRWTLASEMSARTSFSYGRST